MSINPDVIQQIRSSLQSAPHGFKGETVKRWALILKLTPPTIYRELDLGAKSRTSAPKKPELRDWAKIVAQVKKRPPEEAGEISTDQAVRIAIESKLIPVEAMNVSVSTIDRVMRELGTTKKSVRANRIQADRPNEAHHFDASTSNYLFIARRMPDGEYILRLHRPASGDYKNKPVPVDKLRPWYYGLVDDHSGRMISRCTAAQGESAADSLLFLSWAWSEIGPPEELHADQGMLKKCLHSSEFITRLGIALPEYMPYAKRGHGKIERPWRTTWQRFEKPFFAVDDWKQFEIPMTEFNARLMNFVEEQNQRPHRFEKNITRMDAWRRVMLHGGIVKLPENALATVARREKRKVDVAGMFEYRGVPYTVKGLYDAWVYVYEGVFEDRLVVQDIVSGEKFEVKDFKPLNIGEFKNYDDTPHEKAVKASAELEIGPDALPFQKKVAADAGKIVRMPIKETMKEVLDVFDVDHYASVEDAMTEFCGQVGTFLPDDIRKEVERRIEDSGLSKAFVGELAQELRGVVEVQRASAI